MKQLTDIVRESIFDIDDETIVRKKGIDMPRIVINNNLDNDFLKQVTKEDCEDFAEIIMELMPEDIVDKAKFWYFSDYDRFEFGSNIKNQNVGKLRIHICASKNNELPKKVSYAYYHIQQFGDLTDILYDVKNKKFVPRLFSSCNYYTYSDENKKMNKVIDKLNKMKDNEIVKKFCF